MSQSRQIAAFERFSLPGMALDLNPESTAKFAGKDEVAPAPLTKRCASGCGRRISTTKRQCKACYEAWKIQMKPVIAEQLAKLDDEKREAAILGLPEDLRPELPEGFEYGFDMIANRPVIRKK
jgi:hypothetical protein